MTNGGEKEWNRYQAIAEWLKEYHFETDKKKKSGAKALIVTGMLPVIKHIARTVARRSDDPLDDLIQAGSIGLLKAIESYSDKINDNFRVYAGYLIVGEMKHFLRDKLYAIRIPGNIQELSYRINQFTQNLTADELNNLTDSEAAEILNVPLKDIEQVRVLEKRKFTLSLSEIVSMDNGHLSYEEVLSEYDYKETSELEDMRIILKDAVKRLPDKYRKIVELYYYGDLNQAEIAKSMKISKMQVSRYLKKSFELLHSMISGGAEKSETGG